MTTKTLEELLSMRVNVPWMGMMPRGTKMTPQFRVSVQETPGEGVHFIIHADGYDSDTLDFRVRGNELEVINTVNTHVEKRSVMSKTS